MIANANAFYTFRINFPSHYLWVRILSIVKRKANIKYITNITDQNRSLKIEEVPLQH